MSDVKIHYKGEQITVHFNASKISSFSASEWWVPGNGHMYRRDCLATSSEHSWDSINEYILSPEGQEAIFYATITDLSSTLNTANKGNSDGQS